MKRDRVETLVRLVEDIGFATCAMKSILTEDGCKPEILKQAIERLEHSHVTVTEVFIGEEA